jgi:hypothetical protein
MKPSQLEDYVFAYFLSGPASSVNIDGRFRRREEFVQVFEDVFFYSTQGFGPPVAGRYSNICAGLVTRLIETGCLSTAHDKWSGASHQFDSRRYAEFVKNQTESNAICQQANRVGVQFWEEAFATRSEDAQAPTRT